MRGSFGSRCTYKPSSCEEGSRGQEGGGEQISLYAYGSGKFGQVRS